MSPPLAQTTATARTVASPLRRAAGASAVVTMLFSPVAETSAAEASAAQASAAPTATAPVLAPDAEPSAAPSSAPGAVHRYTVKVDRALTRMDVELCLDGDRVAGTLVAGGRDAQRFLRLAPAGQALAVEHVRGRIRWRDRNAGRCFAYAVDLAAALREEGWRRARRYGEAILLRSTQWLWRPAEGAPEDDIEVRFALPEGFDVSVPWQPAPAAATATAAGPRFRVGQTPPDWPARTVIGRFAGRSLPVPGATLRLAVLGEVPPSTASRWLREAAGAVASLYGRFPLQAPQVLVVPSTRGSGPVPWAQVVRGGGAAALFFVDPSSPLAALRDDWTATHEFSHLLIPYVHRDDAWLSEGLASYYQNVLRARAGMLDERTAWERLEAGFARGRAQKRRGTLARLSAEMNAERAYRRVYWSGAAFWLEADLTLRRESAGAASLETALADLRACCLPAVEAWSGDRLVTTLDRLLGGSALAELAARYRARRDFPDLSAVYRELGIDTADGRVTLDDSAAGARWRRAIMGAVP